jgi:sarcosine oxidase subunit gamma
VASLIDKSPCEGLLPLVKAGMDLVEVIPARITSVAPLAGRDREVAAALKGLGLGWPAPNRSVSGAGGQCLWSGRGQAFVVDADVGALGGIAALTDQTDGWAVMDLSGVGAADVLARQMPLDLRPASFAKGHVARSQLGHMMCHLTRIGPEAFRIMVFRSMAATAVHELGAAMAAVAARRAI